MNKCIEKYIILVLTLIIIFTGVANAGSTQTNVSGSNTAIEGGYESSTTYQSGSSSSSTTTNSTTSNIRSSPPTASAPGMNSTANCALALSGGVQTFGIGVSGGKSYRDETCEIINLSKTLSQLNMKVAAIAVLCSDRRVFEAMIAAGTPCPVEGKIGKDAMKFLADKYDYKQPTYEKYVHFEKRKKNKIKIEKINKK